MGDRMSKRVVVKQHQTPVLFDHTSGSMSGGKNAGKGYGSLCVATKPSALVGW
eukprot:evm.model.NODE_17657_length_23989_cov_36.963066.3